MIDSRAHSTVLPLAFVLVLLCTVLVGRELLEQVASAPTRPYLCAGLYGCGGLPGWLMGLPIVLGVLVLLAGSYVKNRSATTQNRK